MNEILNLFEKKYKNLIVFMMENNYELLNKNLNEKDENGVSAIFKLFFSSAKDERESLFQIIFNNFKEVDWFYESKANHLLKGKKSAPDIINLWGSLPEESLLYFLDNISKDKVLELHRNCDLFHYAFFYKNKKVILKLINEFNLDISEIKDIKVITNDLEMVSLYADLAKKDWFESFFNSLKHKYSYFDPYGKSIEDISKKWNVLSQKQKRDVMAWSLSIEKGILLFKELLKLNKEKIKNIKIDDLNVNYLDSISLLPIQKKKEVIKFLFKSGVNVFNKDSFGTSLYSMVVKTFSLDYFDFGDKDVVKQSLYEQLIENSCDLCFDNEKENRLTTLLSEKNSKLPEFFLKNFLVINKDKIQKNFKKFFKYDKKNTEDIKYISNFSEKEICDFIFEKFYLNKSNENSEPNFIKIIDGVADYHSQVKQINFLNLTENTDIIKNTCNIFFNYIQNKENVVEGFLYLSLYFLDEVEKYGLIKEIESINEGLVNYLNKYIENKNNFGLVPITELEKHLNNICVSINVDLLSESLKNSKKKTKLNI